MKDLHATELFVEVLKLKEENAELKRQLMEFKIMQVDVFMGVQNLLVRLKVEDC